MKGRRVALLCSLSVLSRLFLTQKCLLLLLLSKCDFFSFLFLRRGGNGDNVIDLFPLRHHATDCRARSLARSPSRSLGRRRGEGTAEAPAARVSSCGERTGGLAVGRTDGGHGLRDGRTDRCSCDKPLAQGWESLST